MLQTVNFAIGFDPNRYDGVVSRSCRDVLSSGLQDKVYVGDLTDFVNVESAESALQQAYDKALRLMHHVIGLRRARNSLLSIARLPTEILLQVFRLCVPPFEEQKETRHWLAFSQTCSAWRNIALADPSLWNQVDLSRLNLAHLLVERSHPLPLALHSTSPVGLLQFLPSRSRIRNLVVEQSVAGVMLNSGAKEGTNAFLSGQFSSLETLALQGFQYAGVWDVKAMQMPRLQSLTLDNWVLVGWHASTLANLTSLALSFTRTVHHDAQLVPYDIMDVLTRCPRLISLKLEHFSMVFSMSEGPEVTLPHLECLDLGEQMPTVAHVLRRLDLPSLVDLNIGCFLRPSHASHLTGFADILRPYLLSARWRPLHTAAFSVGPDVLAFCGLAGRSGILTAERSLKLAFIKYPLEETRAFVVRLMGMLVTQELVRFELSVHPLQQSMDRSQAALLDVLCAIASTLPALEDLELQGCMCDSFSRLIIALNPSLDSTGGANRIPRPVDPFPALRQLSLHSLRLDLAMHNEPIISHLLRLLSMRRLTGKAVSVLLDQCRVGHVNAAMMGVEGVHVLP